MPRLPLWWRGISIPQRLLIASALTAGGVFALLVAFGRPGLGIGEGFFVPVILAAAATSAPEGALAGVGALILYELAIHDGLAWADFDNAPALTRFISYVAAGVVVGYLAQRVRDAGAEPFSSWKTSSSSPTAASTTSSRRSVAAARRARTSARAGRR